MIKMLPIVDAVARTSHMAKTRKTIEEWELGEQDVGIATTIGEDVHQFLRKYYKKLRLQAASK